jgi:hypothetical protein
LGVEFVKFCFDELKSATLVMFGQKVATMLPCNSLPNRRDLFFQGNLELAKHLPLPQPTSEKLAQRAEVPGRRAYFSLQLTLLLVESIQSPKVLLRLLPLLVLLLLPFVNIPKPIDMPLEVRVMSVHSHEFPLQLPILTRLPVHNLLMESANPLPVQKQLLMQNSLFLQPFLEFLLHLRRSVSTQLLVNQPNNLRVPADHSKL